MKKYKEVCKTHNKNILYFADNNPMCFQCDHENFWVIESFQADQESKYNLQQKSQIIQLLSSCKRRLSTLTKTFDIIKNQQTDKLDNYVEMYLNQNYKIDLIIENIQLIDNLQTILDKLIEYNNIIQPKIVTIIYPKSNKFIVLNNEIPQLQKQEKAQLEKHTQAKLIEEIQIQNENFEFNEDDQNFDAFQKNEILKRVKEIPTRNFYCNEEYFYRKANAQFFGSPIFDEFISKQLDIQMAPKQFLDLDREHNLYEVNTEDGILIFGYSQNYLLNGRGMILNENYIENGFYIKGLLVWGQIFSMVSTNIIYEEIDNTELLDAIQLFDNQQILWNRWHYVRITYEQ